MLSLDVIQSRLLQNVARKPHGQFGMLSQLASAPGVISSHAMSAIERFVVLLYDRTSTCSDVNLVRKMLFAKEGRSLEGIPPTREAREQHVKICIYQGGYYWGQTLVPSCTLPSPWDQALTENAFSYNTRCNFVLSILIVHDLCHLA